MCVWGPAAGPGELPACEIVGPPQETPPQAAFSPPVTVSFGASPQLSQHRLQQLGVGWGSPTPNGRGGLSRAGALGTLEEEVVCLVWAGGHGATLQDRGSRQGPPRALGVASSQGSGPEFPEVLAHLSISGLGFSSMIGVEEATSGHLPLWATLTHLQGQLLLSSPDLPTHLGSSAPQPG